MGGDFLSSTHTHMHTVRFPYVRWRRQNIIGAVKSSAPDPLPDPEVYFDMNIPEDIAQLQKQDDTLTPWFQKVTEVDWVRQGAVNCMLEERYILKSDILYQVMGNVKAMAVPVPFRYTVMTLAHSIPWAGHLDKHKMLGRNSSRLSCPMMSTVTEGANIW